METTLEKLKKLSNEIFLIQHGISACEHRLLQLILIEQEKNFLFYSIEEKQKWYKKWEEKKEKERFKISVFEERFNNLIIKTK